MSATMCELATQISSLLHDEREFTDANVSPGQPILCRTPTGYEPFQENVIVRREDIEEFLALKGVAGPDWKERMERNGGALEVAQTVSDSRLRCSVYKTDGMEQNLRMAVRRLPLSVPPMRELGVPSALKRVMERGKGLFLITGPTGAGKTTTLAALLDYVNSTRPAHIQTIEHPIEYRHERKHAVISQCEVPTNVSSFEAGIEAALRHRPDVLAIGEINNLETVNAVLHAASSGHLVLGTMHTNSCEDTVSSLLQFFDGDDAEQKRRLLSTALIGVISQALVPSKDGKRLLLAYELMMVNHAICNHIREGNFQHIRNAILDGRSEQMKTLNESLNELLKKDAIDYSAAVRAAYTEDGLSTG